ncbi:hypothetical protein [Demequina iriomotensis]|uniref:hypothetical protein n=1 Tax=Demequina iriomotensis TaxID=1536641 RepID=UPI0009E3D67E|nr:hypothetical protein [Demequina iriomotensis]
MTRAVSHETLEIVTRIAARRVVVGYLVLWVLEGAARKWGPGALDEVFYIGRDVMLVGALLAFYIQGLPRRRHPWWPLLWAGALILGIHGAIAMILGTIDPMTLAMGMRGYLSGLMLLVFTLTYADGSILDTLTDAIAILALISLPIVITQVLSAPDAVINQETVAESANFVNGDGVVRPSGTFTAPMGLASFISLGLAVSVSRVTFGTRRRTLHGFALGALALMSAISGSRTIAIVGVALVVVLLYIAARRFTVRSAMAVLGMLTAVGVGLMVANRVFATVLEAFSDRVDQASKQEDSGGRVLDSIFGFITSPMDLWGAGAGAYSPLGSQRLGTSWEEVDKDKYVAELGVLGYALAFIALAGAVWALLHIIVRGGSAPPDRLMVLAILASTLLFVGVTQQPSTQGGFAIMVTLLVLTGRGFDPPPGDAPEAPGSTARTLAAPGPRRG